MKLSTAARRRWLLGGMVFALAAPVAGLAELPEHIPGEVVVSYEPTATDQRIQEIEQHFGLVLVNELPHLRLRHYKLPDGLSVETAIEQLSALPEVKSADPNVVHRLQELPSDPLFGQQWGLHNTGQAVQGITGLPDADIDWPEAMDLVSPVAPVIVSVIDSGVAVDHPEILANTWVNADRQRARRRCQRLRR